MPHPFTEPVTLNPLGVYSGRELGRILDAGPATLAAARRFGALRAVKKGRRVVYLGEWVLAWLNAEAAPGVAAGPEGGARA
jgi:hypothetical protein